MKMAKNRIKTGSPQRSLNTNMPLLWYSSHLGFSQQDQDQAWNELQLVHFIHLSEFSKYLNQAPKVKRFCRFLQYQRRGIG